MNENRTTILESRVEQLEMELNSLKCCGNCFYGAPSNEGILCMTKTGKRHLSQSNKCDEWTLLSEGIS